MASSPPLLLARAVIRGHGTDRVFTIRSGVTVSITNVTIENARSTGEGAAIANVGGTLTLENSMIRNNALGKFGHERCRPCVGGGISNRGTLTLTNVTVSGNSANGGATGGLNPYKPENLGGGIYNAGVLNVTDSTIARNTAGTRGGGGGIANISGAQLVLTNSTVSGNTAPSYGGGIANSCGARATLTNVTVATNSSGIYNVPPGGALVCTNPGTVTVRNSIVANSTVAGNCLGAITSGDFNLDNGTTCGMGQAHDRSNIDPKLGPLATNGASPVPVDLQPVTQTHALLQGSPAVDAGGTEANGCPATDQRGVTRPQGSACDIGSFERK